MVVGGLEVRYSCGWISGLEDHLVEEVVLVEVRRGEVETLVFGACSSFMSSELGMVFGHDWSSLSRSWKMLGGVGWLAGWTSYR